MLNGMPNLYNPFMLLTRIITVFVAKPISLSPRNVCLCLLADNKIGFILMPQL